VEDVGGASVSRPLGRDVDLSPHVASEREGPPRAGNYTRVLREGRFFKNGGNQRESTPRETETNIEYTICEPVMSRVRSSLTELPYE